MPLDEESVVKNMNENEFRVFGMKRSGNHCIINWIASHFNKVLFFNDVICYRSPICEINNNVFDIPQYQKLQDDTGDRECLIYSYEDVDPKLVHSDLVPDKEKILGPSNNFYSIMILRDPLHLIASRVKSGLHTTKDIEMWKNCAKEALHSNILNLSFTIIYDKWLLSEEYRQRIASKFNKENNDSTLGKEAWCGSSYNNNYRLSRWSDKSNYENNNWNKIRSEVLGDSELLSLRQQLVV